MSYPTESAVYINIVQFAQSSAVVYVENNIMEDACRGPCYSWDGLYVLVFGYSRCR